MTRSGSSGIPGILLGAFRRQLNLHDPEEVGWLLLFPIGKRKRRFKGLRSIR